MDSEISTRCDLHHHQGNRKKILKVKISNIQN